MKYADELARSITTTALVLDISAGFGNPRRPYLHDFIERLGTPRPARAGADAARVEAPVAGLRRKSGRLLRQASASEPLVFRGRNHGKRPLRAAAAAYVIEAGSVSERSHGGEAA